MSSGAHATASTVAPSASAEVTVSRRRMKDTPPSASSCAALASSGMNMAVSTEPSTSSVIMLGSVLAVLNADATAGPSTVRMRIIRTNPVIRLARLATAIEPVDRITDASDESRVRPPVPPPERDSEDPSVDVPAAGAPAPTEAAVMAGVGIASGTNESATGGGDAGPGSTQLPDSRRLALRPGSGLRSSGPVDPCSSFTVGALRPRGRGCPDGSAGSADPRGRGRAPPRPTRMPARPGTRRSGRTVPPAPTAVGRRVR